MSKILDNTTGAPIVISDTGATVDNVTDYTIPPTDYPLWAASSDIVTEIGAGNIVVNDGSNDLSISDGTDLIKGIFPNPVTVISEAGGLGTSSIPQQDLMWHSEPFLNAGSPNLNIDGTTPVTFTFAPPAGEVFYVKRLRLQIDDNGSIAMDGFGAKTPVAALTNGVKIQFKIDGTTHIFKILKTNFMITMHFLETAGHGQSTGSGFISGNYFQGGFDFDGFPITLDGDRGDEMTVTVQDDLTFLTLFRMAASYWELV